MKNENQKKVYKIGDKIELNEIEKISEGIVLKALKVIEASGNKWASRIIERKDIDTFEDLKQVAALKLIESNYIITKECYRVVNKYLYNYKKEKVNNIEIVVNEESNASNVDVQAYIEYLKTENDFLNNKEEIKKVTLEKLELTEKQKEILNIYSTTNSMSKTSEILGVAKSTVQVTIERIRRKTIKLIECLEF